MTSFFFETGEILETTRDVPTSKSGASKTLRQPWLFRDSHQIFSAFPFSSRLRKPRRIMPIHCLPRRHHHRPLRYLPARRVVSTKKNQLLPFCLLSGTRVAALSNHKRCTWEAWIHPSGKTICTHSFPSLGTSKRFSSNATQTRKLAGAMRF